MRACVQRVSRARVLVDGKVVGQTGRGLVVLLGVAEDDGEDDADWLADKIAALRVFEDAGGKMNRTLADIGGGVLVVSQFTLLGDCRKGRRPSFSHAAAPEKAEALYRQFTDRLRAASLPVATGAFGRQMQIELTGHGPVTLLLDSHRLF